ncbi:MAG TPA: nucleoside triphosphate pyrophosphohydrolase [Candidatus Saccharimonadales bacterium]|nr:nucleoside triphosphate pyrophosphohydrolase [Candidatus Saccharimonadales bacterium]
MKYDKLVRDNIPEIIEEKGETAKWHLASKEERLARLIAKAHEETDELETKPSIDELADLYEVVLALADELGIDYNDLEHHRSLKAADRGSFSKGIVLDEVTD